jgi:hypothetical protein
VNDETPIYSMIFLNVPKINSNLGFSFFVKFFAQQRNPPKLCGIDDYFDDIIRLYV